MNLTSRVCDRMLKSIKIASGSLDPYVVKKKNRPINLFKSKLEARDIRTLLVKFF